MHLLYYPHADPWVPEIKKTVPLEGWVHLVDYSHVYPRVLEIKRAMALEETR